jgi:3-oxoacyl-[acyl-carrier protein] reductase
MGSAIFLNPEILPSSLIALETIISLHNTAPFKIIRAAAPYFMLKDGESRSIINVSSASGIYGNAGQASYALAKAGLVGLTKTIAQEWGPEYGVRANSTSLPRTIAATKR